MISGGLIIVVGVVFWATNGLGGVPELIPAETQAWLQQSASPFGNPLVDGGADKTGHSDPQKATGR